MKPNDNLTRPAAATSRAPASGRAARHWLASAASVAAAALGLTCPACVPAIAALLSSLGVGAAAEHFIRPVLVVLLGASVAMLGWSARQHRRWWVVATGAAGAALIYAGRYLWLENLALNQALLWTGAVVLVATSVLNVRLRGACRNCPPSSMEKRGCCGADDDPSP